MARHECTSTQRRQMMEDRARELLAAEYEALGGKWNPLADCLRENNVVGWPLQSALLPIRAISAAILAEREECARVAKTIAADVDEWSNAIAVAERIEAAIRNRSKNDGA